MYIYRHIYSLPHGEGRHKHAAPLRRDQPGQHSTRIYICIVYMYIYMYIYIYIW